MISQQLLEILRCPLNPRQATLEVDGNRLVCQQCRLRFPIKEGFPSLVIEEAELPAGCEALSDLPCQQGKRK
jgi:uncharacterized protein YbaR (Trm112 family)